MDIVHLIQSAVAPVFLLSGVGVTLGVLTNRLARIVDRARAIEDRIENRPGSVHNLHEQLEVLARRSRYINTAITMCAIAVTLFLGGPSGPGLGFLESDHWLNVWVMPVFWFMFKLIVLLYGTVWVRASLPRLGNGYHLLQVLRVTQRCAGPIPATMMTTTMTMTMM